MFTSNLKAKSLLGLTIATCVSAVAFPISTKAEIANITEILVEATEIMNQNLPMMVDPDTRWDSSFAGPGKTLGYKFTFVNYSAHQIDGTRLAKSIRPTLTNLVCNDPATKIFPDNGVNLNFNYYDNNNNLISRVEVTPHDCHSVTL